MHHKFHHGRLSRVINSTEPLQAIWIHTSNTTTATGNRIKATIGLRMLKVSTMPDDAILRIVKDMSVGIRVYRTFRVPMNMRSYRYVYLTSEVATTLAHIKGIKAAFDAGSQIALIIEDSFAVTDKFLANWRQVIKTAPVGWEVLQMYCTNPAIVSLSAQVVGDGFIQWMSEHYSTGAYLINRAGMKKLLDASHTANGHIKLPDHLILSDMFVYAHTASYTSLEPMVSVVDRSRVTDIDRLNERVLAKKENMPYAESIKQISPTAPHLLILSIALIRNSSETGVVADRLFRNLVTIVGHARVKYALLVLLRDERMRQPVKKAFKTHHYFYKNSFFLEIKLVTDRFNKFRFVNTFVKEMDNYDYVLLADNDLPFAGYPWEELFRRSREAGSVVTGTARQEHPNTNIKNIAATPFKIFDGTWWKQPQNHDIEYVYISFIEQYFSLIDGSFAKWFFTPFLASKLWINDAGNQTISDWGPDQSWCGAAAEWLSFSRKRKEYLREPCALLSLVIMHENTKEIADKLGREDRRHKRRISTFRDGLWWNYSAPFRLYIDQIKFKNVKTIDYADFYRGLEVLRGSPAVHRAVDSLRV